MPEGPEVKRTTERLNRFLQGSKLHEIVVEDDRWFQNQVRDEVSLFILRSVSSISIILLACQEHGDFPARVTTNIVG